MKKKNIFIKTFGCQMNEYDSNRIYDNVSKLGFIKTENQENAECYILNTCHIRDKAKEKVYHEIGRVKKLDEGGKLIGKVQQELLMEVDFMKKIKRAE